MTTVKNTPFALYKPFIDAYMKGHPEVAKCLCHYNALAEWNKIKNDAELIQSHIKKYLDVSKQPAEIKSENVAPPDAPTTSARKRTISSDDEVETFDPLFDPIAVTPVEPTFSKRSIGPPAPEDNDKSKPWVARGLEKAQARIDAYNAKIEAKRLAKENRVKAPVQEALVAEIKEITDRIANLIQVKNMGLSTEETNYTLEKLIKQKKTRSVELSLLRSKQRAGLRYRARRKKRLENLCSADPEVAAEMLKLYKASTISVQTVENVSPDLLQTIEEIARVGGVSDHNANILNNSTGPQPCRTLDELREKIRERNFEIRRSSLFYRLIPAGAFSEDGKKHSCSTAVRLRKILDVEQPKHPDCYFVAATLKYIKDLAGTFGNDCVFYLVQDSKASVRIGRPAARGHSPLIMHLDYQISTADSAPIPATTPPLLKPVVYASCVIDEIGVVTNIGPTYVSIRSAKHDRIGMESTDMDFDQVVKLKEFEKTARNHIGEIKPIIIMSVDDLEPNNYTCFPKTLYSAIQRFKKYNLDALLIVTQAPGQSIFGVAERRIALFGQDLTGLVLPHNYFGAHLNISGLTVDAELEMANLKRAGEVLAEVWSMNMIDRQQVVAEFIDPPASAADVARLVDTQFTLDCIIDQICDEDEEVPLHQRIKRSRPPIYPELKPAVEYDIDEYWCATHVFQTQYTIQIIRCTKTECCGPWRSNYIQVFPHRFLPPPVPFHRSSRGVRLAELQSSYADQVATSPYYGTLFQRIQFHGIVIRGTQVPLIPFDAFCPSVQSKLQARTCTICKQYIPSAVRLRNHYRVHQQRYGLRKGEWSSKEEKTTDETDPIDPRDLPSPLSCSSQNGVVLFADMKEWLRPDFEEDPATEPKPKSVAANAMAAIRKEKQLQEEAAAAIADSAKIIEKYREESAVTILVDDALSSADANETAEIKAEAEDVTEAIEQLNVTDDKTSETYDDLSDLIDKI